MKPLHFCFPMARRSHRSKGNSGGGSSAIQSQTGNGVQAPPTPPINVESPSSSSSSSRRSQKPNAARIPIPMLDPTDFPSWEFKMHAYLMSYGYWGVMDSVSDNWEKLDPADQGMMKASTFVIISHSLGELHEYIAREFNPNQPKVLWEKLQSMFNKTSLHTQLNLTKKWANLQWQPDHNVESFLGDIAQLRAQHKTAGVPISDDAAFVKLISSLPKTFDTEISVMEDWQKPDLDRARTLLLKRQNAMKKRKFEETNALMMEVSSFSMKQCQPSSSNDQNPKKKRKFTCYYCGKSGHVRPNCKQKLADERNGIHHKNTKGPAGHVNVISSVSPQPASAQSSSSSVSSSASQSHMSQQPKAYNFSLPSDGSQPKDLGKAEGKSECIDDDDFGFFMMMPQHMVKGEWIIDSGASHHLCMDSRLIANAIECNAHILTGKANADISIKEMGLVEFTPLDSEHQPVHLSGVLFSNEVSANIISVPQLIKNGCSVAFENDRAVITFDGKVVCSGIQHKPSSLYVLSSHCAVERMNGMVATLKTCDEQLRLLHNRLGHLNRDAIIHMSKENLANGLPSIDGYPGKFDCPHCWAGKATHQPYPKKKIDSPETLNVCDEFHSDTFGPMTPMSCYKHSYIIIFVDKGSCFAFLIGLTSLDQVPDSYRRVRNIIATQLNKKIKRFICDGHSTFISACMQSMFEEDGTFLKVRAPYRPEQNGLSERQGCTTIKMGRTLLLQSGVPPSCWEDALLHANYIRSHVPTRALPGTTPFQKFWGYKPDLQWLCPFGCLAFTLIHKEL